MIRPVRSILSRLHGEERGTALTEFVISLPVFVLIFSGIVALGDIGRAGLSSKFTASQDMWDRALPVQANFMSPVHMSPQIGAATGGAQLFTYPGRKPIADVAIGASYVGLGLAGTEGEAFAMRTFGAVANLDPSTLFQAPPDTDYFATDMWDDTWPNPLPMGDGILATWNAAAAPWYAGSFVFPRHSLAAGTRYGQELGSASNMYSNAFVGSSEFKTFYDVQVAPHPVETEFAPVAFSRLGAEEYDCFKEVLGINWNQPFIGCELMLPLPPFP